MHGLLEDKAALITGASGDIGGALAEEFARAGARVVLHSHRHRERAESAAAAIASLGGQAFVFQGPLDAEGARRLIEFAVKQLGALDILVNNAGASRDAFLMMQSEAEWRDVLESNLLSTMFCCQEAVRIMLRAHSGSIVNVSSLSGVTGLPGQTAYSASKAGVIGLTKALAREVGAKGIRVNALAPGLIESRWTASVPAAQMQIDRIALGRLGHPTEVAKTALFLASEWSSYITGSVIHVNGGLYTG